MLCLPQTRFSGVSEMLLLFYTRTLLAYARLSPNDYHAIQAYIPYVIASVPIDAILQLDQRFSRSVEAGALFR